MGGRRNNLYGCGRNGGNTRLTLTPLLYVANKSLNYNDTHTVITQGDSSDTIQYFYLLHVHYLCQQIQQQ